ncbi:membrane protein (plasmid) [Rhizobium leguminosarum bv. trifolii CB782]|uniref:A24 family peptidase n=1 Tax=Rhizobium hidalgonense TaxID=1538159 RepID=UPI0003E2D888|nr:A24 family peptidase [Rhizobium hidalgonense]AHG49635.1 membrane protein [Rhizobium leguminosarum bv. trifolii CB782]QKK27579.1 prepilin peptidase [Rhizobium hidalgonense]RWX10757.1 prepilin peptidase [Rhizobium hidalgonense]
MDTTYDLTLMPAAAALAVACATTAAVLDHRQGHIPNAVTYPCLLAGFMLAAAGGGLAGIGLAFAGVFAAGMIFIIAFAAGSCGGGDVKLMAALGAILGLWPAIDVTLASLMVGGVIALVSMARRVQWSVLARNVGLFALLLPAGFRDAASVLKPRETHHTVRFGVAAALGLLWCLFMPDFTPLSLVR